MLENYGYCGFACALCPGMQQGCPGCRKGGGEKSCYQRTCCAEKGLEGCWQCASLPCDRGFFVHVDYGGVFSAFAQAVQQQGLEETLRLARAHFGDTLDFDTLRGKASAELLSLLTEAEGES